MSQMFHDDLHDQDVILIYEVVDGMYILQPQPVSLMDLVPVKVPETVH